MVEGNTVKQSHLVMHLTRWFSGGVAILLRNIVFLCVGMAFPFISSAAEQVNCINQQPEKMAISDQSDRLHICALIGVWDTIITGNNRHGYSGEVVAWVDDSVTAVRAAIHNLDLLQCASLDPSALAQASLHLVTQISDKEFGKKKLNPFELATRNKALPEQTPCESADINLPDKLASFAAGASPGYFQSSVCAFEDLKLPDDFVVFAAGAYTGRRIGYQIDQSGKEGTQIDVAVNHAKPVVLMLGAYEPTIWNIGWTPDTRIVAVLASGYHRQIVAGLKGDVPIIISSYDNQGACGYYYANNTAILNPLSRRLFNHPVDMIYPAQAGRVLVGKSIPAGIKLVTSTSAPPASFYDASAPLAGETGLDDAIQKGLLRRATPRDSEEWAEAERLCSSKQSASPINEIRILKLPKTRQFRAYVVLKPLMYPAGLFGANSAIFYVPKGIPRPIGNPGHSTINDFNAMDCSGGHAAVKPGLDVSPSTHR